MITQREAKKALEQFISQAALLEAQFESAATIGKIGRDWVLMVYTKTHEDSEYLRERIKIEGVRVYYQISRKLNEKVQAQD